MAETLPIIEARDVEKFYEHPDGHRINVIAPTSLRIADGQIVALLGPSGSGKSTFLRMLTGLSRPSAGEVLWEGVPVGAQKPNAAIVFQSFALFPWLTVLQNVEAPLQARGVGAIPRRKRALRILDTVGLDGFETAYPKELSGGMKQRVGFARALVVEPLVLFMDEPFSALDVLTAENLRSELLDLWQNKKMPTRAIFFVTHNIEEAITLADRVIVLGRNPARIRTDFEVKLPHPRDYKSPEFIGLVEYVYKVLTKPEAECSPPLTEARPGVPERVTTTYPMLPHSRPGGISGLVEMLLDLGGRVELYRLAEELGMEVDDLLPTVEAATLLGFLHLHEGNGELTPEGRAFAEADIDTQKVIFREAALKHVPIVRQMDQALRAKSDHRISDDFYLDILDDHYSEDEAKRQLDTAISWGRFAEIFNYDSKSGRLFLSEP
jgi:NitT/TauT family transport system ATP-binding protein